MSKPSDHDDRRLKLLQNKLSALYGRVQQIYDSSLGVDGDVCKIEQFLADAYTVDKLRDEFLSALEQRNEYQLSARSDEGAQVPNYSSLIAFEQLYTKIKYSFNKYSNSINISNNVKSECRSSIKLPPIELCTFDGEIETWPLFYETFKSLIHDNTDLSDGEKVHYLIGKLKGKALSICQGIIPSAENYSVIWNTLINKYNDTKVLASSYLDKIFNLPSSKEIPLEEFIDKFSAYYLALKQLKFDNLEDIVFIYIACKKLNVDIVRKFELYYDSNKAEPKCIDFIKFIREHSHTMLRAASVALPTTSFNTKARQGTPQTNRNNYLLPKQSTSRSNNNSNKI